LGSELDLGGHAGEGRIESDSNKDSIILQKHITHFAIAIAIWATGTFAIAADSGSMNDSERAFLLEQMEQSKATFLASISGLSQAQWTFKPAPEVWSVAECAEHVVLSEDFIFNSSQEALKTPAVTRLASGRLDHDRNLAAGLLDRSQKAAAPAPITPGGHKIATPADAARMFVEKRDRHIVYVKTTHDDLRTHAGSLPGSGPLDAYQLILLTAAHSARHTEQIKEVEANANYPVR
jgi:hypothetical protein